MMMSKIVGFVSALALVLVFASLAQAQATRTWVSGTGDDANPRSRTAPRKTFAGAISKTTNGGEINCLDSAGFGNVTVTTIRADLIILGSNGSPIAAVPGGRLN